MIQYITPHPWQIIEDEFHPEQNEISESLMSLGNGRMGQRGNFEEKFSGHSLLGNYVAGVYFPDKTRVGWWKNGYPDYFAKVINACNWIGIEVDIEGETLDLATCAIESFRRVLDMKRGVLTRECTATTPNGKQFAIKSERFCSMVDDEAGAIRYLIKAMNFGGQITLTPNLDGTIRNRDANYDEVFWDEVAKETSFAQGLLTLRTKPNPYGVTQFDVTTGMRFDLKLNGKKVDFQSHPVKTEKYVAGKVSLKVEEDDEVTLYKFAVNLSSANHESTELAAKAKTYLDRIAGKGYAQMLSEHEAAWAKKWEENDIEIEGNVSAQQGIRFNIFQLEQTYTGEDATLNIGPKGFTGEKYGGVTYWDTEAYCLPFYMAASGDKVARNLLVYRHNQLGKAIENAAKLGFLDGAALYPMVTMNGEESHNEWEITFEEIHRNGAIAYAIYDYITYTGDKAYLSEYGLEVLIAIARFWRQRVNWSAHREKFVMLGVTGPNEYENNVNDNWYTNYIAVWCLKYTLEAIEYVNGEGKAEAIFNKTGFNEANEPDAWREIIEKMHFPYDPERQVFLQQDGFLDKDLKTVDAIEEQRPINQNWSWDRILRSCFIKQADVLQGLYFFEDDFDKEEIRRNFDFYEPMTVHESSLSPCVHSILASGLGKKEKAYEMYVRTARLDLDDYNDDTEDGLHITSMAGTWMSIVKGFAGQRVREGKLVLAPYIPDQWESYTFRILYHHTTLIISVDRTAVTITNASEVSVSMVVLGQEKDVLGEVRIAF